MKKRCFVALFLLTSILLSASVSASVDRIYFAGFAFLGDSEQADHLFPYSANLASEMNANGISVLEAELSKRIRKNLPKDFILDTNLSVDSGAIAIAFALAWENITIERLGNLEDNNYSNISSPFSYSIVIDLYANILVFDFKEKKIISSFPVGVKLKSASLIEPDEKYLADLIRNLYLSNDYGINIFDEFVQRLGKIKLKEKYGNYVQITSVNLSDATKSKLLQVSPLNTSEFAQFVGLGLTNHLSTIHKIGILPFTKGQAIGGKMPARFANAEMFMFTLPDPDYVIEIEYLGFGKKELDNTPTELAILYVTGFRVLAYEPLTGRIYANADFRENIVKKLIAGNSEPDDWSGYQLAFWKLARVLSEQIIIRSDEWLSKHSQTSGVSAQLAKLEEVLNKCR